MVTFTATFACGALGTFSVSQDRLRPAELPRLRTLAGHLVVRRAAPGDGEAVEEVAAVRLLDAFGDGDGSGLLQLGTAEVATHVPPSLAYWRDFATRYVAAVCAHGAGAARLLAPDAAALAALAGAAPPMSGAEYVTEAQLAAAWRAARRGVRAEVRGWRRRGVRCARGTPRGTSSGASASTSPRTSGDDERRSRSSRPTRALSARGAAQHVPLGQALEEYAGARDSSGSSRCSCRCSARQSVPVARARWSTAASSSIRCAWTPREALRLLARCAELEAAASSCACPLVGARDRRARR